MIMKKGLWVAISFFFFAWLCSLTSSGSAAEKLKFATSVKVAPVYYLPMVTAEEQGFWKKNGLEAEWVPFEGGAAMFRAVAAGVIDIGFSATASVIDAAAKGLAVLMVSDLYSPDDFPIWVRTDSRIRAPQDLKGVKIGVARLGGTEHFYALAVAKALGFSKDVRVIGAGGIPQSLAGLKAGAIDAVIQPINVMIDLKVRGEVRAVASNMDYLPKEWVGFGTFATKDLMREKPETVRKAVRAVLDALDFIINNPGWSIQAMKTFSGYSEAAAKLLHEDFKLRFTRDGRINREAIKNVRDFTIEYVGVPREKVPPADELYTETFTR